MRFDVGLLQARRNENERRQRRWRVVKAVAASLAVGGTGLIFGFAMGLHDARWSGAWAQVGHASFPFSDTQPLTSEFARADAT